MTDHPVRPIAPGRSELHVQQQTHGRSSLGLFPAEDEPRVVASLLEDLHLEAIGTDLILQEYLHVVPDPRRQERARALVESIRRNYSNAEPSNVDLKSLIEFLYFGGHQRLLRRYHLRFPAYNILDDFFTGAAGPSGPRAPERPVVPGRKWSFLGHEIGFPIGVPASVLTSNAEWVHYFARNGYNVLTYRTVRSRFRNAHPSPNWVLVPSVTQPLPLNESLKDIVADPSDWLEAGVTNVTTSNSFGVPSYGTEEWQSDLREALHVLHEDQVPNCQRIGRCLS